VASSAWTGTGYGAWAFVRSVDNALWSLGIGEHDVAFDLDCARMLAP
jgi:hypothetical protein